MPLEGDEREIQAKYASPCSDCGGPIFVGEKVLWSPTLRSVRHFDEEACYCVNDADAQDDAEFGSHDPHEF